jgi:hypothetical protein
MYFLNRVKFSTPTTGTGGTIAVGAASSGFRTPAQAGAVDARNYRYKIEDTGNAWEIGYGAYNTAGTAITGRTVLQSSNSDTAINLSGSAVVAFIAVAEDILTGGTSFPYILIRDEQTSGTGGGTFTSGSYQTRTLNTEVHDTANLASVASNQITLAAGTYRCRIVAPAFRCGDHKAKLYNVTDSADVIIGTSALAQTGANTTTSYSFIVGRFTIAATKVLEVRHRASTTQASNGFGSAVSFGDVEVYTVVELWLEA